MFIIIRKSYLGKKSALHNILDTSVIQLKMLVKNTRPYLVIAITAN